MSEIEVYPQKNGEWRVRRRDGDKTESLGKGCDTRADALEAALEGRDRGERVVLLRKNGSFHGELAHADTDGDGQDVGIEPASESGEAS